MKLEDKQIVRMLEICADVAAIVRELPAPPKGLVNTNLEIAKSLRASVEKREPVLRELAMILRPILEAAPAVETPRETEDEKAARLASYLDVTSAPRSPQEISLLLRYETPEETQQRINSDVHRHSNRSSRRSVNPNIAIATGSAGDGNSAWAQR